MKNKLKELKLVLIHYFKENELNKSKNVQYFNDTTFAYF